MLKNLSILFFCMLFLLPAGYSQYNKQIDSLSKICNNAKSDSDKIVALDKLAAYYYIYKLNNKADSILQEEVEIAEVLNNKNLKYTAYFGDAILNIGKIATSRDFDKAIEFIEAGTNYAVAEQNYTYTAIGYSRLSQTLLKRGENDQALEKIKRALETLLYISSDSLKAAFYIDLGNAYKATGDYVSACRNYNIAFDHALNINSVPLQSRVYQSTSDIYSKLNIDDEAKAELDKSVLLNTTNKNYHGLVKDYYDMARLTNEKYWVVKTREFADSVNDISYIYDAKDLMLAYLEYEEKDSAKAINFLETEPDFKQVLLNAGIANYYNKKAEIYLYSGKADSALTYFKLAENDFVNNYSPAQAKNLYWELGMAYDSLQKWNDAIVYYNKVREISQKANDIVALAEISDGLSNVYSKLGRYKEAYQFSRQSIDFKNQLKQNAKENIIALSGVERENRKHAEEIKLHDIEQRQARNQQYMLITAALCFILMIMLVVGAFPVSKTMIQTLGYFFFISLFEFIVLFIDNTFLASTTHNQPLKLWIIKIGLIACLVPIQHFMEHNLIKYLQSRKLLEARTRFSFKKIWAKIFRSHHTNEETVEEDTAIL